MYLPLLFGLSYASASSDIQTQSPQYSILSPAEDVWAGNARFVKEKRLFISPFAQKLFMTKDPDFALAHQFSSIGLTTIVVGSATTVGALLAAAIFGTFGAIDGDDTIAHNSLKFAGYSALSVVAGTGMSVIGSSLARKVLISKGEEVSFAGGYIATAGVGLMISGFGTILHWGDVQPSELRQDVGQWLLASGITTIPIGLVTQHLINRMAYNKYFDSVSLTPTFSTESVGAMVQVHF